MGQIAISAPNPVTADVDLAYRAIGDRRATFIEQINGCAGYGTADGWSPACPRLEHREGSDDGAFGRAVVIDYGERQRQAWALVQHVASGEHQTERGSSGPVHAYHGCGVDGGNEADGYAVTHQPLL